jgi:hypothetical protein
MNDKAIKIKEQRSALLHVRIKVSSFNLLIEMVSRKQKTSKKRIVMADIIENSLKHANGQVQALFEQIINENNNDNPTENPVIKQAIDKGQKSNPDQ